MSSYHHQAADGAIFAQIYGPNTEPVFLGCHGIGDVDIPKGDIEVMECPDPANPNGFVNVGSIKGAPGTITATITADIMSELDYMERADCPVIIYVHKQEEGSGRRDDFTNYKRSFVLVNGRVTNEGLSNLATRTSDENGRSEQSFDLGIQLMMRIVRLVVNQQTISEANSINALAFCGDPRCRTSTLAARLACQSGYAACDAGVGVSANVLHTTNGSTWTATDTDPFGTNEDVIAVACIDMGGGSFRALVARGSTDAYSPAELAYSDDEGATWVQVEVDGADGAYVPTRHSLFALNRNRIWLGTSDGDIFFSSTGGSSWVALEEGVIHSGNWNAIHFADAYTGWAVGDLNVLAKTIDGGVSWSEITGPTAENANHALTVSVIDLNRAWVGYSSGRMYYTNDSGATWTERDFFGNAVGQVRHIFFTNEMRGYLLHNNASPVGRILHTFDGGYTWEVYTIPDNDGLNFVWPCDQFSFYATGEASGGTGWIAKGTTPVPTYTDN